MTLLSPDQQAIGRAMGYEPVSEDTGETPYPVETALPASCIRKATLDDENVEIDWPMVLWQGEWYSAPTVAQVEAWVFNSVVETPDERDVEPDDPDSWLSILGMI